MIGNKPSSARRRLRVILLVILAASLALLAWLLWLQRPLTPHRVTSDPHTIRILFIGNSYIYVNNLPGLLMELSAHEAKPVDVEMVVEGGMTLYNHWIKGQALAAIQRGDWDYVVLQEQSTFGSGSDQIGNPAFFQEQVRHFNTEIEKTGAKTLLYMTWARQNAPQNQTLLTSAYMDIANELHIPVAPVGLAWQQALMTRPELILHQDDGSHPNPAGTYLAACVFYATIYQKSPEGLPAHIASSLVDDSEILQYGEVNLSSSDALFLQQTAWKVVSES